MDALDLEYYFRRSEFIYLVLVVYYREGQFTSGVVYKSTHYNR